MNRREDEILELAARIFVQRCGHPDFVQDEQVAEQCFELAEMFLRIAYKRDYQL